MTPSSRGLRRAGTHRRWVALVYGLILVIEIGDAALTPLLPSFRDEYALSAVEAGAVLSVTSLAIVVVATPIGLLSDRVGPRGLTLTAGTLGILGAVGLALAVDFWSLLGARALHGAALGGVWTAGLAWLSQRARAGVLGGTISVGGLGQVIGPVFAGQSVAPFGPVLPFAILAGAGVMLTIALARVPAGEEALPRERSLLASLRELRIDPRILAAFLVMALVGLNGGTVRLLVPIELDAAGLSEAAVGRLFSAASFAFLLTSVLVARIGDRAVTLTSCAVVASLAGAVLLLPIASTGAVVLVIFLLLRAPLNAHLSTVMYPLGAEGARVAAIGTGTVVGLLNVLWGGSATVGPLLGGAIADTAGVRWAFASVALLSFLVAAWILAARRGRFLPGQTRPPRPPKVLT